MGWDDDIMDTDQTTHYSTTTITETFDGWYLAYPLSHVSKTNYETGNKIIMPASALEQLASISISYPMLFRIENTSKGLHSHCGVVEFTADEGFVFMPTWMMNNMQLQEGELVNIKNISLPKGNYIKIQPHVTKFTTLTDHKSLLEKVFREFVCLTTGDTIVVNHGYEKYLVDVVETKPSPAILMFETDCEVDFAPPLDYKEPEKKQITEEGHERTNGKGVLENKSQEIKFKPFTGVARRVDGQPKVAVAVEETKFKPFTRVAQRVDGDPMAAVATEEMVQEDQSNVKVDVKKKDDDQGFKAFTGKSYRLL